MKIIGIKDRNTAICEVGHDELEKFLGLYYGKLDKFEVRQEIDLAKAYDHHSEIVSALKDARVFIKNNGTIVKAITDGILIATRTENGNEDHQS